MTPHAAAHAEGRIIEVRAPAGHTMGVLVIAGRRFDCALGRSGIVRDKHEGDGGTPAGRFALRGVLYRPDRRATPATALPVRAITPQDGWCDAAGDPAYNRGVRLPYRASHEQMWREDHLYDLLAVIGYNDDPPLAGAGSAIFLHLAHPASDGLAPTAGCVALPADELALVLAAVGPGGLIDIALA
jgi:L,D-peptidoglycan transpeptidase YkuD (ErfK/YbiS/YcfS/YnhG family)